MDNIELYITIGCIIYGAGSEVIAHLPIRENSWVQLGMRMSGSIFGNTKNRE